jgi:thiol:disulfide interchange protein/DsbC/DsbD-like thiol-disulfide interchange protein
MPASIYPFSFDHHRCGFEAVLLFRLVIAALAGLFCCANAFAAVGPEGQTDNVRARIVADHNIVVPGQTLQIGLLKNIRAGWHTYWINPGSAGQATEYDFDEGSLSAIEPIIWPLPKSISIGRFVTNYGYEGELLLPRQITLPQTLTPGSVHRLTANAFWLVCEDICIPEELTLTIDLQVGETAQFDTDWGGRIDREVDRAPKAVDWPTRLSRDGDAVLLTVQRDAGMLGALRNVDFFPIDGTARKHSDAAMVQIGEDGVSVRFAAGPGLRDVLLPVAGLLRFEAQTRSGWQATGVIVDAEPGEPLPIGSISVQGATQGVGAAGSSQAAISTLGTALLFAFLGGLILNLMPCVFPILFVKALSFAKIAHDDAAKIRAHGLLFLAGVVVSFVALAGLLIALQAGGALIGWGFQLQSPLFVVGLAALFVLIGLNLLGLFEIGTDLQGAGSGLAAREGGLGAFFTGVLAVVVATPCTAPFMAGALGFTLGQPAPIVLLVFVFLGLGLAAPFVLLSFFPDLFKMLPKPGAWMNHFKHILAFPMFLTAVWLLWVYGRQLGVDAAMLALAVLLVLAFAVTVASLAARSRGAGRWIGFVAAFLMAAGASAVFFGAQRLVSPVEGEAEMAEIENALVWTPEIVASLQGEGKAVFVDFTAAWCITCKFNERSVLATRRIQDALEERNVAFVVADWTARDDVIAAELRRHGRTGVPLYLLYSGTGGEPQILPQLLTAEIVLDALERLDD